MFISNKQKDQSHVLIEGGGLPTMAEVDKIIQNNPPGSMAGLPQFPGLPGRYGELGGYGVLG
jgi:hypothetical protein